MIKMTKILNIGNVLIYGVFGLALATGLIDMPSKPFVVFLLFLVAFNAIADLIRGDN